MASVLDQLAAELEQLPKEEFIKIVQPAIEAQKRHKWLPTPGPQEDAYYCEADLLLYGGEGGGGKSELLAGLALTAHRRSLIMRRQYTDLGAMIERVREIDGSWKGFNGSPPPRLRTADNRIIDFGAAAQVGDEQHWQGQPHDFLGIDEAVHFAESQIRFVMGWVRSTVPGQRSRTVLATNPPITAEGDFIIGMFRPWLDLTHHNPAKPGELRWYVSDPDGKDFEVDGPEPYQFPGDARVLKPHSRTFLPAGLKDNPFLSKTNYSSVLDSLPEPLRSAIRDGNFMAIREDDVWQMIPTEWIREAQQRHTSFPPAGVPMCAMSVDPASGGADKTIISFRHDGWFAPLIAKPGVETPNGRQIAGLVIMHRTDNAPVIIDMGGGYGGVPYTTLENNHVPVIAHKGAEGSMARTADRKLAFYNKRTEVYWKFREALDPAQMGGSGIALPEDQELLSDLTSIKFSIIVYKGVMTIKAETKEEVVKRLHRSPDKGDAVVNCWGYGEATALGQIIPRDSRVGGVGGRMPKTITSRDKSGMNRRPRR